jgi:hypothetical protein
MRACSETALSAGCQMLILFCEDGDDEDHGED